MGVQFSVDGSTWTEHTRITATSLEGVGATQTVHYHRTSINWIQNDWVYFGIYKAIDYSTPGVDRGYKRYYALKTPNDANIGRVWYNHDETFTKNVFTEGYLTDAELQANFQVFEKPDSHDANDLAFDLIFNGERFVGTPWDADSSNQVYTFDNGWNKNSNAETENLIGSDTEMFSINVGPNLLKAWGNPVLINPVDLSDFTLKNSQQWLTHPDRNQQFQKFPMNIDAIPKGQKFLIGQNDLEYSSDPTLDNKNNTILHEMVKT